MDLGFSRDELYKKKIQGKEEKNPLTFYEFQLTAALAGRRRPTAARPAAARLAAAQPRPGRPPLLAPRARASRSKGRGGRSKGREENLVRESLEA